MAWEKILPWLLPFLIVIFGAAAELYIVKQRVSILAEGYAQRLKWEQHVDDRLNELHKFCCGEIQ